MTRGHKYCAAIFCNNNDRNTNFSHFRFPSDKERFRIWAIAAGRQDLLEKEIKSHSNYVLCEEHFEHYMFTNRGRTRLKPDAKPVKKLTGETTAEKQPLQKVLVGQSSLAELLKSGATPTSAGVQNATRQQQWVLAPKTSLIELHKPVEKQICSKDFSYLFSPRNDTRLRPETVPYLNLDGKSLLHYCRYTSDDAALKLQTKDFTKCIIKQTLSGESVNSQNNNFQELYCNEDQAEMISNGEQENIIIIVDSDDGQNSDEVETIELPVDTGLFGRDYQENANQTSSAIGKPYFKSVKCYMSDCGTFTEVCRVCFRSLIRQEEVVKLYGKDTSIEEQTRIKNMLKQVLPDLDLEMFGNTAICKKCKELLEYSYQLKQTWLSAEALLQTILEKNKTAINQNASLVISNKEIKNTILSDVDHDHEKIFINQEQQTDEVTFLTSNNSSENVEVSLGEVNSSNVIATEPAHCHRKRTKKKTRGVGPCMCEKCGRIYSHPVKLKRHVADFHIKREDGKKPKEPEFMCEICGKLFLFYQSLAAHYWTHAELMYAHKSGTFQCHLCGKQLANVGSFKSHLQGHGPKRKTRACGICDKKFTAYRYLRKHIHSGIGYPNCK